MNTKKHQRNSNSFSQPKKTTESYGMGVERVICSIYRIDNSIPIIRCDNIAIKIRKEIETAFESKGIRPVKHLGYLNGSTDFILDTGQKLSVKTNTNGSKVCPQNIGQTTPKRFVEYFDLNSSEKGYLKEWIVKNPVRLFREYFKNLFSCDYLLWVNANGDVVLFKSSNLKYQKIFTNQFSFTRTGEKWKESSTLKLDGTSIGEFQFHKKRNCIKFRFHLKNLLKMITPYHKTPIIY